MKNQLMMAGLAALAFGFVSTPRANGGTETVQDYGGREVAPRQFNYAPPPPRRVYYAPPPIGVAVYPRVGYYRRPLGIYRFHRPYLWRHRHWR